MRKKFVHQTYMREVNDSVWHLEYCDEIDGYIALKYIKDIQKPLTAFCNGKRYVGLDKCYSVLEYVPNNRNYNCRVFFNDKNEPLCYYFDINNGVGIEDDLPWYDDLYLDVTMECNAITEIGNYIRLDDEMEFKKTRKEGLISEELYQKGYDVAIKLMTELRQSNNDIVKRSTKDLVRIKKELKI